MKIWTGGSFPRSGSLNACTRIKNVNGASRLSNFWIFFGAIQMISCCDWWSWTKPGYITITRRQSNNQWSGGIAAHLTPKIPSAKIRWKISRLDFLGSRRRPPHWLSSKWPHYQRGVLLISAGAIEEHCEGKTPREGTSKGSCSCTTMPRLTGHLQPRRNWPTWASSVLTNILFSGSGPVGLPPVPWTEKTIERSPFFVQRGGHCCRGDLVGRTTFWIFFFLTCLQKLEQRAKKSIELRGEYVE